MSCIVTCIVTSIWSRIWWSSKTNPSCSYICREFSILMVIHRLSLHFIQVNFIIRSLRLYRIFWVRTCKHVTQWEECFSVSVKNILIHPRISLAFSQTCHPVFRFLPLSHIIDVVSICRLKFYLKLKCKSLYFVLFHLILFP